MSSKPTLRRRARGLMRFLLALLTIGLSLGAAVSLLLVYRHVTIHTQVPAYVFLVGIILRGAFIVSIIVAVIGFAYGLLARRTLADLRQNARDGLHALEQMLRRRLFRSPRAMLVISSVAGAILLAAGWYVLQRPPRFYTRLVASIIWGTSDDYARARALVARVARIPNNDMAEGYEQALHVLSQRSHMDYRGERSSLEEIGFLGPSLEMTQSTRWQDHPLRWYALGELYGIYAEQSKQLTDQYMTQSELAREQSRERVARFASMSKRYFDKVLKSRSNLATRELKSLVMRKKGNMFARLGRHEEAMEAWRSAQDEKDTGTMSSVLFGMVLTGKAHDAVGQGREAAAQARNKLLDVNDPSTCSRIYANTALAAWIEKANDSALVYCLEAVVIQDDPINRLYFAHALIRIGRHREAEQYLRSFMTPVTPENVKDVITSPAARSYAPGYLLWVLADADATLPIQAARLYAALGEGREACECQTVTGAEVHQLLHRTVSCFKENMGLCFDFMLVPATMEELAQLGERLRLREPRHAI
jgi:tetratricopeptide (TPR) repeat protein